jgi:DNA replicative helicase MCM subunit Mcm2 (Cdc46/Mcm family)
MFGVVICDKCHRGVGVNLRYKTTKCPYCNYKLELNPKKIKFKCDSERELSTLISKVNQELQSQIKPNGSSKYTDFGDSLLNLSGSGDGTGVGEEKAKDKIYENLDPYKRIAMKFRESLRDEKQKGTFNLIIQLVQKLGSELGEFGTDDFITLLKACGLDESDVDEHLEKLKETDVIFEPRHGVYKLL